MSDGVKNEFSLVGGQSLIGSAQVRQHLQVLPAFKVSQEAGEGLQYLLDELAEAEVAHEKPDYVRRTYRTTQTAK